MYARVTALTLQRDKEDDAISYLRGRLAEIRQQKGFHDLLFLLDRASGRGTILTLWKTEGDLRASEASGYYPARMAELALYIAGQTTREVCEVAVEDLATISSAKAVRMTSLLAQPGKIDEIIRLVRDSILPASKQQKGARGLVSLVERGMGKGITLSFWESEADLKASESSGYYQAQLGKVLPLCAGQPVRDVFELALTALVPAPVSQPQPHAPSP